MWSIEAENPWLMAPAYALVIAVTMLVAHGNAAGWW